MNAAVISFTLSGIKLSINIKNILKKNGCMVNLYTAKKNINFYDDNTYIDAHCKTNINEKIETISCSLHEWTNIHFKNDDVLVFIGACGIAVRSIAPFVKNKCQDAAVIVVDDIGQNVISLLSGHIGGANYWTNIIASGINANPVITTSSDIHNTISIDLFAQKNNLYIKSMEDAKRIEAAILDKKIINLFLDYSIEIVGDIPEIFILYKQNCDTEIYTKQHNISNIINNNISKNTYNNVLSNIHNDIFNIVISPFNKDYTSNISITTKTGYNNYNKINSVTLFLIPKIVTLGIGCKRKTKTDDIKEVIQKVLKENKLTEQSIKNIATIDLKKDEKGLICYAKANSLPILYYSADELNETIGNFASSDFVRNITGTDNICERAAVRASGNGHLIIKKYAENGVTVAAAIQKGRIYFEYK